MRKTLIAILLALMLVVSAAVPVFAADSAGVTVTATPLYLCITNITDDAGTTWLINGLGTGTESGKIKPDTIYYSKAVDGGDDIVAPGSPVADADCYFTVTCCTGAVTCDLTVTWGDFSGGADNMTNGNTGSNGATSYGAWCYYSGLNPYVTTKIVKSSGSDKMYTDGLAADASLKWGVAIETQTTAWTGGTSSTSTLTITATEH